MRVSQYPDKQLHMLFDFCVFSTGVITCAYNIGFRPYRLVRNNLEICKNLKILLVFEFEFSYNCIDFIDFDVDLVAKRTSQNCNVPLPYGLIPGLISKFAKI